MSAPPIIDIHTHLAAPGSVPDEAEMQRMMRLAAKAGVGKVIALGNLVSMGGANPTQDDITAINSNTLGAMKAHPDFFIGFCYLNPSHPPEFSLNEMERCIVRGGMSGVKLWVAVKATDKRHDPLFQRIQELDVPVLYHAWYKAFDQGPAESTPAEIADLARRFPKVTIVMAHLTGDQERGVLDIRGCENVLIDTSGGQPEAGLVEYAVEKLGAARVIYGSDWPVRDFAVQVGRVAGARISDRDKEMIFTRNAQRILKLEGAR
ncbi:MAG TPA: amidohydrolase family protein [Planctomycetota bacterium]|nr:amidohydrolase family protein [Planctomycetota bacterium]